MALRATKPEVKEKRLKMFVYGPAGVGKTVAALQFPQSYVLDCEKGTDFYSEMITRNKSVRLQTLNPDEIREEIKALLTEKHQYRTLIIDPITQVYNAVQEKWNRIFEKYSKTEKDKEVQDFGMRYWGKVKSEFKGLQRMMIALDMNCIITSHQKDVYGGNFNKVGVTFDSMRGDDYLFDLVFRIEKRGEQRIAITEKERAEPGCQKFPPEFEWSYDNFLKFYGKNIIEKEAVPVAMAAKEQVAKITKLIDIVKIDESDINKWFNKASVNDWEEMTSEQIEKCIKFVSKKLAELNEKEEKPKTKKGK
jgi:Cdc6-like AAA superfamily ATPase